MRLIKFNQYVDVAFPSAVVSKRGAEDPEFPDMMAQAG